MKTYTYGDKPTNGRDQDSTEHRREVPEVARPLPVDPAGAEQSEVLTTRASILKEAMEITAKDRNRDYDEPERNFQRIADLFSVYLGTEIEPHDVAVLMMLTKVARIMTSPTKRDHWVDAAGYAACGGECVI